MPKVDIRSPEDASQDGLRPRPPLGAWTRKGDIHDIERSEMLNYALLVFAIAALGGLVLAAHVLRGKFAPWALSLLHALLGATGLALLIVLLLQGSAPQRVLTGFVLLLLAALGGFFLASFHVRKQLPPKAVVIIHAGVAVAGFLTLLSLAL
jgi:hypothetical protein